MSSPLMVAKKLGISFLSDAFVSELVLVFTAIEDAMSLTVTSEDFREIKSYLMESLEQEDLHSCTLSELE